MLSEIFDWWVRQMLDLLPRRVRHREASGMDALVLQCDDPGAAVPSIAVSRRVRGASSNLGSFVLDGAGVEAAAGAAALRRHHKVILRIPPSLLLQRDTELPLAAEADIDRVLGYEMDRITPFAAAELFWTWGLQRRDRALARLYLRLSMVPRVMLEALLHRLGNAGLAPDTLAATSEDGTTCHIPIQRLTARQASRRMAQVAGSVCALLLCAVVTTPFVQSIRAIDRADEQIAALRPRMAEVETLRRQISTNTSGTDVFAAERTRVGDAVQTLATLTEILPDDTWLSGLTLRQRILTFSGQSARAARLIGILSADPAFKAPAFATPVTRADSSGADLFSIRTEIRL